MESTNSGSRKEKSVSLRLVGLKRFVLFCCLLNCLFYFFIPFANPCFSCYYYYCYYYYYYCYYYYYFCFYFICLRLPLHPFCLRECELIHIWRQFVVTVAVPFKVNSLIINLDHQFVVISSGSSLCRFFLRKRFYFIQSAFCNCEQCTECSQPHTSISTSIKKYVSYNRDGIRW